MHIFLKIESKTDFFYFTAYSTLLLLVLSRFSLFFTGFK